MKINTKITQTFTSIGRTLGKNAPIILTIGGVVGLGATAVFSYKAAKKVEVIVEGIESSRMYVEELELLEAAPNRTEKEEKYLEDLRLTVVPVDRFEVAKNLAGAVALPVATGVGSIAMIILSYQIQNNRIVNLAAALATASAERVFYNNKFKKEYGEAEYERFHTPTERTMNNVTNAKGVEEVIETTTKADVPSIHGEWFDKSSEYAKDDHDYNLSFIRNAESGLQLRMFRKGFLLQNEVNEALGLPRTRAGALLGWSTATGFDIFPQTTNCFNKVTGELDPQIYVKWTTPTYIYETVEYEIGANGL